MGLFFSIPLRVSLILCITIKALGSIFSASFARRLISNQLITVKIISVAIRLKEKALFIEEPGKYLTFEHENFRDNHLP